VTRSFFLDLVLNPVRARMMRSAGDWPWSSYRTIVREVPAPEWLQARGILAASGETADGAVPHYARFVADGKGQFAPWERLKHQVFLGSDAFVEAMRRKIPADRDLREVPPQAKARPLAKPLSAYARKHPQREDQAIAAAYASGGYTMPDIGDYFGLHHSHVSKIVRAGNHFRSRAKGKPPVLFSAARMMPRRIT
jgi:hypothetical protein